jgi:hypothetical protein
VTDGDVGGDLDGGGAVASAAEVLEVAASDLDLGGGGPRGERHGRAAEPLPPPSLSRGVRASGDGGDSVC